MENSTIYKILESAYDKNIAEKILSSYIEIETNFFLEKWKISELDAGHFVESVRRLIEFELFSGKYTDFSKKIGSFNDQVLIKYENTKGDESFRLLIPRVLKSIYNIRNKRGVGHIGAISPNKMDATLILYSVKWVLSEILRLKSNSTQKETQELIDNIVEKKVDIIWKGDGFERILNPKMSIKEQLIILLYDKNDRKFDEICKITEYKNKSRLKKITEDLHGYRILEFKKDGICILSPKGIIEAEKIVSKYKK